jgi:HemY protein
VRALFWVLLLAAAAVAITLAARYNAGYVLLVLHPYRIEFSLNFLIALMLIGFAALYALLRVVVHAVRLPNQVRQFRERRRLERAA